MSRRRKRFMRVYHRLSQQGWCDGEGGMESRRVYREWVEAGCPPLKAFIRWRANIGPTGDFVPQVAWVCPLVGFPGWPVGVPLPRLSDGN